MDLLEVPFEEESSVPFLDKLPWDDVVYKYIFRCLTIKHLFKLRATSKLCLRCVGGYFSKMRSLRLVNLGTKFKNGHFKTITKDSFMLRIMVIREANNWLQDDILLPVLENNESLERVDFSQSNTITNVSIQKLVITAGRCLQELTLRDCHWLENTTLNQIGMNCPRLKKIDVSGCWQVDDNGVSSLVMLCHE